MLVDADGVLRARHTHLALYQGFGEADVRNAIADNRGALEIREPILDRIENLHGNTVLGHYLTAGQARVLAEAMYSPVKKSQEAFETYLAFEGPNRSDADKPENGRDAEHGSGTTRATLQRLRSRIARRLFQKES